jgi:hypothetical protein
MNPTSQPFKDHPFAGAYIFRSNQLVPMDAKEPAKLTGRSYPSIEALMEGEGISREVMDVAFIPFVESFLYTSSWNLPDLSTRLSDFIQEGIESGTFDNSRDLRASVLNFLTFHQKQP